MGRDGKLKIAMLHAISSPDARPKEGGVIYVVHWLANKLVERGHEVTVHTVDPKPNDALYNVRQVHAPLYACFQCIVRYFYESLLFAREDFSTV